MRVQAADKNIVGGRKRRTTAINAALCCDAIPLRERERSQSEEEEVGGVCVYVECVCVNLGHQVINKLLH